MKMFSGSDGYETESTGYESYGEDGYSHFLAHWLEDDNDYSDEDESEVANK